LDEQKHLLSQLESHITPERLRLINEVAAKRTKFITVALEDIFQPHNASAVLRSCDCFGVQDVHIIENRNVFYNTKGVDMGSVKWLDLHRYHQEAHNTAQCLTALKKSGYRIAAMALREDAVSLYDFELDQKTAFVFGNEEAGLSDTALSHADIVVKIPMAGFTQSFNISVSAALTLSDAVSKLSRSKKAWRLNPDEQEALKLHWLKKMIRGSEKLEEFYMAEYTDKRSPAKST
jgi:tRNA (guanosine-2'-O-)-methyltransferase